MHAQQIQLPFDLKTTDDVTAFDHDWMLNPAVFGEWNQRYALCNPLLLDLERIRAEYEAEFLDARRALIAVFSCVAGWARVTNQVYATNRYDYRALADRLGMAHSTMRDTFKWGVKRGLWSMGSGCVGVELTEKFLSVGRRAIGSCARDILQNLRGRMYPMQADLLVPARKPESSEVESTLMRSSASRVHSPDLNSVSSRELVAEIETSRASEMAETSSEKRTFLRLIIQWMLARVHEHYQGSINRSLLEDAANALWQEGCQDVSQARRYIFVMVGALRLRGDTSHYPAHTIAIILRDDADQWRQILRQTPESRAAAYRRAQRAEKDSSSPQDATHDAPRIQANAKTVMDRNPAWRFTESGGATPSPEQNLTRLRRQSTPLVQEPEVLFDPRPAPPPRASHSATSSESTSDSSVNSPYASALAEFERGCPDTQRRWRAVLAALRRRLPTKTIDAWFGPMVPVRLDTTEVVVVLPDPFRLAWCDDHDYGALLEEVVPAVLGVERVTVRLELATAH